MYTDEGCGMKEPFLEGANAPTTPPAKIDSFSVLFSLPVFLLISHCYRCEYLDRVFFLLEEKENSI